MRQILTIVAAVIAAISFIAVIFTLLQANQQQLDLTSRAQSRAQLLADSLSETITPAFRSYSTTSVQTTIDKFANEERIEGLAVFDTNAQPAAISDNFPAAAKG